MSEHRVVDLTCGCATAQTNGRLGAYASIIFCPTHEAAPDLFEALEVLADADDDRGRDGLGHRIPTMVRAMVDAALAKARGK